MGRKKKITINEFKKMFYEDRLPVKDIAKFFNVSEQSIFQFRFRNVLKRRKRIDSIRIKQLCKICNKDINATHKRNFCSKECYYLYLKNIGFNQYTHNYEFDKVRQKLDLDIKECMFCGYNETTCDSHHIIPLSNNGENLLYNIITLCPNCHRKAHNNIITKEELFKIKEDFDYEK